MKTIKATHIDTGGHGYLSVAKSDFLQVCSPRDITGYSGHNLTRIYLEEDIDASTFMDAAKAKGIKVDVKSGYNLKFSCNYGYKPELFNFKPELGKEVELHDGLFYTITGVIGQKMIVAGNGKRYGISLSSCFKYIVGVRTEEKEPEPSREEVLLFAANRLADLLEEGKTSPEAKAKYDAILALSKEEFYQKASQAYKSEKLINQI